MQVCDGKNCASGVPGMGAVGTGESFRRNIQSFKRYKVVTRLIHIKEPDTSAEIFDQNFSSGNGRANHRRCDKHERRR